MSRMSSKDLQATFKIINEEFFNNRIPKYKVRFADMVDDGLHVGSEREILINSDFKSHPDVAMYILIHEMNHADLQAQGYVGWRHEGGHGSRFQAGIEKLFMLGIYDGIL